MDLFRVLAPVDCSADDLEGFRILIESGEEVDPRGLIDRIANASKLVFRHGTDGEVIGIAALKIPNPGYRQDVFANAGSRRFSNCFAFELGWVFVVPKHRHMGIATEVVRSALRAANEAAVFATTRTDNGAMRRLLEGLDFAAEGATYSSSRGPHSLQLFIRLAGNDNAVP